MSAAAKEPVPCTCIDRVNASLLEHNTKLVLAVGLGTVKPVLRTEKSNAKTRRRPVFIVPDYCPFCGVKYAP